MPTTQMKSRENAIDDMWRTIFGPKHEPKREFKKRARHTTIVVNHPTPKAARKGMIRARLPLMADGLTHIDVTPEIIRVAEYPLEVTYEFRRSNGQLATRTHVPDLALVDISGRVIVIDYEPINIQKRRRTPVLKRRKEAIAAALLELDATYVWHDESSIHLQPRWHNVCEIWKHMQQKGQHPGIVEIRKLILLGNLPASIGQLMRRLPQNAMASRFPDEPPQAAKIMRDVNPVYTAVLQLAAVGKVRLDHSLPLSINSIVTRKA